MSDPDERAADERDEALRERLSPEQYEVTQRGATERPFSGAYVDDKRAGVYRCVVCGAPLFDAATKYDSGTGWPSFHSPIEADAVGEHADRTLGMTRTEVHCEACAAHLGHVFPDGPQPTGLRYCINSAALELDPDEES